MRPANDPSTSPSLGLRGALVLAGLLAAACGHDSTGSAEHGTHEGSGSGDSTAATAAEGSSSGSGSGSSGVTGGAVLPPAAPTDLVVSLLEGGVHSTWKDASDNEDNFVLEKQAAGAADYTMVAELPFDSVTYHDNDVTPGTMYTYRVKAVNAGGEAVSNEVMITVP